MLNFDTSINPTGIDSALQRVSEINKLIGETNSFQAVLKDTKEKFGPEILEAARENNLDPKLLSSVIEQESGFNPNAVSSAGAMGLMQLMPETARTHGVKNPFNVRENIRGGAKYLSSLLNRYQHNVVLALSAYNAGPGNVEKYKGVPPFAETKNYVKGVLDKLHS